MADELRSVQVFGRKVRFQLALDRVYVCMYVGRVGGFVVDDDGKGAALIHRLID